MWFRKHVEGALTNEYTGVLVNHLPVTTGIHSGTCSEMTERMVPHSRKP